MVIRIVTPCVTGIFSRLPTVQRRYPMFESMSVAFGIIFGLAGFALAVFLGITLYKDKTVEAHHAQPVADAPEHETA